MTTVGLLYPGHSAEDDFPAVEARLGGEVRLRLVHTDIGEDAHRVDALLRMGGAERLAAGAAALAEHDPDSVIWACTSASFVFGWDGAHEQVAALGRVVGRPTSSTSLAFVDAVHALGLRKVAVAASYPEDVAVRFVDLLAHAGIEVVGLGSHGIITAAEVGTFDRERVLALVRGGDVPGAEAVLVPDTAMHTLAWVADLEAAVGKPVLTANQVSLWQGLRLAGAPTRWPGLGRLLAG